MRNFKKILLGCVISIFLALNLATLVFKQYRFDIVRTTLNETVIGLIFN